MHRIMLSAVLKRARDGGITGRGEVRPQLSHIATNYGCNIRTRFYGILPDTGKGHLHVSLSTKQAPRRSLTRVLREALRTIPRPRKN